MTINYEKKPCYDIVFTSSFDLLAEELQALGIADRRVAVIADSCTKKLFGDAVCGQLEGNCKKVVVHAFPAGEAHKTLDTVKDIYKTLIDEGFDRRYCCPTGRSGWWGSGRNPHHADRSPPHTR